MSAVARLCVVTLVMATGCRQILGFESAISPDEPVDSPSPDTTAVTDAPADSGTDGPPPDTTPVDWTFRKPIKVVAGQVSGTLASFPVMVRLASDADLATSARDDGFDIKFTAADGTTQLPHEIERFNGTTGELVAWVRMTVDSNADTNFFLYYGFPGATDQRDKTGVWDSNYVAVYHLDETAGTAVADSTAANRTGTKTAATTPSPAASVIGGGQSYSGLTDGISIGNANALDIASITFETWINVPACANDVYRRIVDFPAGFTNSWVVTYPCTGAPGVNQKSVVVEIPDSIHLQTPTNSLTSAVAHHLVFQSNPTKIYIDGVDQTLTTAPFGLAQDNTNVTIGNREGSPDRAVIGTLDEVRISRVRRSQAFIVTSFNNQRPNSTFLSVAAPESAPF